MSHQAIADRRKRRLNGSCCRGPCETTKEAAVDQAVALAKGEKVTANSEITNDKGEKIQVYLITGEMVTKENIDKVLIESGYYTKEQIYGTN